MKTFDELTIDQRMDAYKTAKKALQESLKENFVEFAFAVPHTDIDAMAEEIAENATYTDEGKPYVEDMEVPYHFLGDVYERR